MLYRASIMKLPTSKLQKANLDRNGLLRCPNLNEVCGVDLHITVLRDASIPLEREQAQQYTTYNPPIIVKWYLVLLRRPIT